MPERPRIPVLFVHHRSELGGAPASLSYLIRELDDDEFATREAATARLESLGRAAEAALKRAVARGPSAEARRRIENILENLDKAGTDDAVRLRPLRVQDRLVHQIWVPYHWGYTGTVTGDSAR